MSIRWTYTMFLNTDIRKMHVHIVQFCDARIVLDSAKTAETQLE